MLDQTPEYARPDKSVRALVKLRGKNFRLQSKRQGYS